MFDKTTFAFKLISQPLPQTDRPDDRVRAKKHDLRQIVYPFRHNRIILGGALLIDAAQLAPARASEGSALPLRLFSCWLAS